MTNNKFKGLGVALVTPFLDSGEIDFYGLDRLVDRTIANGANYLVALGTTSEAPTLSEQEKREVVREIVRVVNGRVPIMLGLGGPSTNGIIRQMKEWELDGISAFLSVTPYYNRPSQEGLYLHYKTLSENSPLPIILYNIRSRTACNLEAETTLRLANDCKNIIGIKEASGNLNQIMKLIKHSPEDFLVISGDDAITLPLLAAGADGVISVIANAYPKPVARMVSLALNNRFEEARRIHLNLLDIIQCCFKEGNPSGIKAVLCAGGIIECPIPRLPLVPVSAELSWKIADMVLPGYLENTFDND